MTHLVSAEPIFHVHAEVADIRDFGVTPVGHRRVIDIVGGRVEGARLQGRILPGADWQILWPDGTRSSLTPHPSVIIGNKSSVVVGQGVFVGQGNGAVPLDNPSSPYKLRCAVLDGVSYCN